MVALVVVATLLVIAGLVLGLIPVGGAFDSESFHCGMPFAWSADNSEGYRGSAGFDECDSTRKWRSVAAVGMIAVGAGLGFLARRSHKAEPSRDRDSN